MATGGGSSLKITVQGGRSMLLLPAAKAAAVRTYLQTKGISASHPELVTADTSSIEFRPKTDLKKVQDLLDHWGKPPADEK